MPDTPGADEYLPLLKTQKNEAFAWIEEAGFDPHGFEVKPGQWGQIPCTHFAYQGSPYFFDVNTARRAYSVRYSPGQSELMDWRPGVTSFEAIKRHFVAWLTYLRREVEAPDLWAMAREAPWLFHADGTPTNDDPFTPGELAQIVQGLDRARTYLVEVGVTGELLRESNEKLDYLVEAAGRSGRREWRLVAFSMLWSVVVAAAFSPEQARMLFETVASAIRQLLPG